MQAQTRKRFFVHLGNIRLQTMAQPDGNWLQNARSAFNSAVAIQPSLAPAYYFMGIAIKQGWNSIRRGRCLPKFSI